MVRTRVERRPNVCVCKYLLERSTVYSLSVRLARGCSARARSGRMDVAVELRGPGISSSGSSPWRVLILVGSQTQLACLWQRIFRWRSRRFMSINRSTLGFQVSPVSTNRRSNKPMTGIICFAFFGFYGAVGANIPVGRWLDYFDAATRTEDAGVDDDTLAIPRPLTFRPERDVLMALRDSWNGIAQRLPPTFWNRFLSVNEVCDWMRGIPSIPWSFISRRSPTIVVRTDNIPPRNRWYTTSLTDLNCLFMTLTALAGVMRRLERTTHQRIRDADDADNNDISLPVAAAGPMLHLVDEDPVPLLTAEPEGPNRDEAQGKKALALDNLPFMDEGWRHCMLIFFQCLRCENARCQRCVNALANSCKSVHRWFDSKFDLVSEFHGLPPAVMHPTRPMPSWVTERSTFTDPHHRYPCRYQPAAEAVVFQHWPLSDLIQISSRGGGTRQVPRAFRSCEGPQ